MTDMDKLCVLWIISSLYSIGHCQNPVLTIKPDTVWEPSGLTVTLTCDVQGRAGDVAWLKDDKQYSASGNPLALSTYTVAEHDGNWKCRFTPDNRTEGTSNGHFLTVNSSPKNDPPLTPTTIDAYNTDRTIAECVFVSKPDSTIRWTFRNGSDLPPGTFSVNPTVAVSNKYYTRKLTLEWQRSVTTSDKISLGNLQFICSSRILSPTSPTVNAELNLTIAYKPIGLAVMGGPATDTVIEGSDVTRSCQAACNPPCTYIWTEPSISRPQNPSLVLRDVDKNSNGTYNCTASNAYGDSTTTFKLDVEYAPIPGSMQLYVQGQFGTILAGHNITLTCSVDSKPGSQISFHNVSMVSPALYTETGVTMATYSITAECHTLTFFCVASNKVSGQLGKDPVSRGRTIRIQCAPSVYYTNYESGLVSVDPGKSAEILVGLLAFPFPLRTWSFQGRAQGGNESSGELPDNVREGALDGNVLSLIILETGEHNVGQYTLTAENSHGQVQYSVELVVGGGVNAGLIAGCVTAAVVVIVIVVVVVLLYRRIIPLPAQSLERLRSSVRARRRENESASTEDSKKEIGQPQAQRRPSNDYESDQPRRETMDCEPLAAGTPSYLHTTNLDNIHSNIERGRTIPISNVNREVLMSNRQQNPPIKAKPQKPAIGQKPNDKSKDKKLYTFKTDQLKLKDVLNQGEFFIVQEALKLAEPDQLLIIKKAQERTGPVGSLYWEYLRSQAECLQKLKDNAFVLPCSGILYDDVHAMVMPKMALGSVREYLQVSNLYENLTAENKSNELMALVHDIVSGLVAIANIQSKEPILHYALNADHVMVSADKVCQVTGFASAARVRDREQFERDNKHPRPVRWLAPEAIDSEHIQESDVWSLGVLMWEIYSEGALPHGDVADDKVVDVVTGGGRLRKPEKCSRTVYTLISRCMCVEPKKRAKFSDVFAELPTPPVDYVNTRQQPSAPADNSRHQGHYVNKSMIHKTK